MSPVGGGVLTNRKDIKSKQPDPLDIQDGYDENMPSSERWIHVSGDPLYSQVMKRTSYKLEMLGRDATLEDLIDSYNSMVRHVRFEEDIAGILDTWRDDIADTIIGFEYTQEQLEARQVKLENDYGLVDGRVVEMESRDIERDMKVTASLYQVDVLRSAIEAQVAEAVSKVEGQYLSKIDDLEIQLKDMFEVIEELEDRVDGVG